MLEWGIRQTEHPVAIRVPANGVVRRNVEPEKDYGKTLNRYEVSHRGEKVAILGLGSFYQLGEAVAARLKEEKEWMPRLSILATSRVWTRLCSMT